MNKNNFMKEGKLFRVVLSWPGTIKAVSEERDERYKAGQIEVRFKTIFIYVEAEDGMEAACSARRIFKEKLKGKKSEISQEI